MSGRSFEFYNNLGRFNSKITTQKSGRWNKPVIVIAVVTYIRKNCNVKMCN
jgi:hypothetical protein